MLLEKEIQISMNAFEQNVRLDSFNLKLNKSIVCCIIILERGKRETTCSCKNFKPILRLLVKAVRSLVGHWIIFTRYQILPSLKKERKRKLQLAPENKTNFQNQSILIKASFVRSNLNFDIVV
jgi:hypothetical protein